MKKFLIFLLIMSSFLVGCNKNDDSLYASKIEASNVVCDSCTKKEMAKASGDYGIYGFALWPVSGTETNVVQSPTVYIYKMIGGVWTYQGSTVASMCGYYTYNTNGVGYYKAQISGYYYLRSNPGCSTQVDYGLHAGSGDGYVTIFYPWRQIDVRCS